MKLLLPILVLLCSCRANWLDTPNDPCKEDYSKGYEGGLKEGVTKICKIVCKEYGLQEWPNSLDKKDGCYCMKLYPPDALRSVPRTKY